MAIRDKFEIPTDPELRLTWVIAVGSVVVLFAIARIFRDVNPG